MNAGLPSAMTDASPVVTPVAVGVNPFSRRATLLLVVLGAVLFVALLWLIAMGTGAGSTNDGQAHAGGQGLNGYAAMAAYLEKRGYQVVQTRNKGALARPGLLVLTPPAYARGRDIDTIVAHRRHIGPTLVIAPKWTAVPVGERRDGKGRKGWVELAAVQLPSWEGFLDTIGVSVTSLQHDRNWHARGLNGPLPALRAMESGGGTGLVRLVAGPGDRATLVGFMDDGGRYPRLEAMAMDRVLHAGEDASLYPVVLVFEPDLVNNWGFSSFQNARLAEALVRASGVKPGGRVTFDLTLNGFGQSDNLLTLAFRPPFLAATLCLLMAALLIGWRGFVRFGPPIVPGRAIAFGKRALVENTAGMIRRSRRPHLIGGPYAQRIRRRLSAQLGLARGAQADSADVDAALDRMVALRRSDAGDAVPFSVMIARLEQAKNPQDLLNAARDLHALERMLLR